MSDYTWDGPSKVHSSHNPRKMTSEQAKKAAKAHFERQRTKLKAKFGKSATERKPEKSTQHTP